MDPIRDIEDKKTQTDIGVFAARIFNGAKEEGLSQFEAWLIVCAWFVGMFADKPDDE